VEYIDYEILPKANLDLSFLEAISKLFYPDVLFKEIICLIL
jgi:hypothetical protein